MTESPLTVLAYEETPLGPLCLRRRRTLSEPPEIVTEITLNHEFLMSSLHTDSERALAQRALGRVTGSGLKVMVGGLGLGYTALAALGSDRVACVEVVEYLPPVIDWTRQGLTPIADRLNADPRFRVRPGDVYGELLEGWPRDDPGQTSGRRCDERFDAILIDVDHSPEDRLAEGNGRFYTAKGIRHAASHLEPGGVLALWSYDEHTPTFDHMRDVLFDVEAFGVTYLNRHVHQEFTDWLYLGTNPDANPPRQP